MIYIILLSILVSPFLFKKEVKFERKSISKWIYLVPLICVAAFAYNLGADTQEYVSNYKLIQSLNWLNLETFMNSNPTWRPGFIYIFSFFKSITNNYLLYQVCHAVLMNAVIYIFVRRYSSSVGLTLFFYCMLNFLDFNYEIQRESFCILIGLFIYKLLDCEYSIKTVILSIIIAFLSFEYLHRSAFILIMIPVLTKIKLEKKHILIAFIFTLLVQIIWPILNVGFLIDIIAGDTYKGYLNQEYNIDINNQAKYLIRLSAINVIIPYFFIYISYKIKNPRYLGLAMASVFFECLSDFTFAFHRLWGYLVPFYWIILSDGIVYVTQRYRINRFLAIVIMVVYLIYTYHEIYFVHDPVTDDLVWARYYPYVSIFDAGAGY